MRKTLSGLLVILASAVAGCGGGGSGSTPVTQILSFPLQAGYKALISSGLSKTFSVSGTCTGSGSKTVAPATTSATFEGATALSSTATLTMSLTNCTPASTAQTFTSYVDANYAPLGFNSPGVNYGVYLIPAIVPVTVSVGATATIGTETLYADSTKKVLNGTQVLSYTVQADTSSTAIINLIAKNYNAAGTLTATEQDLYRVSATGALTPISADIQYANGSTTHLLLTYN